jgi:sec-independent protein translocase protein TatA
LSTQGNLQKLSISFFTAGRLWQRDFSTLGGSRVGKCREKARAAVKNWKSKFLGIPSRESLKKEARMDYSSSQGLPLAFISMPGGVEWIIIGLIALLLFGKRLPGVAKSLGQAMHELKSGLGGAPDAPAEKKNTEEKKEGE